MLPMLSEPSVCERHVDEDQAVRVVDRRGSGTVERADRLAAGAEGSYLTIV